jgi:D-alanyl-D-alanine carboxypeptidase/D-alanyl-D-alanine-endopeptidase (penicillin-binding protein 4)
MSLRFIVPLILSALVLFQPSHTVIASDLPPSLEAELKKQIGPTDSVLLAAPNGHLLISNNADRKRVPASTLKVLTALAALHHLGSSFRYPTDFYKDKQNNLIIKGHGDPLLISEEVESICIHLSKRLKTINGVFIDDSYVSQPVRIHGRNSSLEPYDAPNGGVGVNFNTVFFKTENGTVVSGEPQTPLLPLAMLKIRKSGLSEGRITLSHDQGDICNYAGEMFAYFLEKNGVALDGQTSIAMAETLDASPVLVYRHNSRFNLDMVIQKLLKFSNNYIANQVLLTLGATCRSTPATIDKGVAVLKAYSADHLGIVDIDIVEGSGISRLNRISAIDMLKALAAFRPYFHLLKRKGGQYFKTGTLSGISTRVGYFDVNGDGKALYPFVVFLNTKGKRAEIVTSLLGKVVRHTK